MNRVLCPRHPEDTPSCVIYPDYAYCYGGCGRIPLSEVGGEVAEIAPKERFKENLQEAREYIGTLPTKTIRGFDLPYDDRGYYLCWGGDLYYKRRNWQDDGAKYKNPAGHSQPPYWARRDGSHTLVIQEGELNALSVALAFPEFDVVSPGSASDFKTERFRTFLLSYCIYYDTVIISCDYDGPGTEALIHATGLLINKVPTIYKILLKRDANQVLCESGKDTLREEISTEMRKTVQGKAT